MCTKDYLALKMVYKYAERSAQNNNIYIKLQY